MKEFNNIILDCVRYELDPKSVNTSRLVSNYLDSDYDEGDAIYSAASAAKDSSDANDNAVRATRAATYCAASAVRATATAKLYLNAHFNLTGENKQDYIDFIKGE